MVGHQHVSVQGTVVLECGFTQFLPVVQVIGFIGKAGLAIIAALDDMLGDAGQVGTGNACHVPVWA